MDGSSSAVRLTSAIGFSPLSSVISVVVEDQATQTVVLSDLIPSSSNYADVGSTVQVQLV